jgi:hypothetical protein
LRFLLDGARKIFGGMFEMAVLISQRAAVD